MEWNLPSQVENSFLTIFRDVFATSLTMRQKGLIHPSRALNNTVASPLTIRQERLVRLNYRLHIGSLLRVRDNPLHFLAHPTDDRISFDLSLNDGELVGDGSKLKSEIVIFGLNPCDVGTSLTFQVLLSILNASSDYRDFRLDESPMHSLRVDLGLSPCRNKISSPDLCFNRVYEWFNMFDEDWMGSYSLHTSFHTRDDIWFQDVSTVDVCRSTYESLPCRFFCVRRGEGIKCGESSGGRAGWRTVVESEEREQG